MPASSARCNPTTGATKGHTCLQTGCAKCQDACPNDAIVTKEITVTVKGDFAGKEKIGGTPSRATCWSSSTTCAPTAASATTSARPTSSTSTRTREVAFKCDLCDGEPQCIAFCQNPHVLAVDLKVDKKDKELAQA